MSKKLQNSILQLLPKLELVSHSDAMRHAVNTPALISTEQQPADFQGVLRNQFRLWEGLESRVLNIFTYFFVLRVFIFCDSNSGAGGGARGGRTKNVRQLHKKCPPNLTISPELRSARDFQ